MPGKSLLRHDRRQMETIDIVLYIEPSQPIWRYAKSYPGDQQTNVDPAVA